MALCVHVNCNGYLIRLSLFELIQASFSRACSILSFANALYLTYQRVILTN